MRRSEYNSKAPDSTKLKRSRAPSNVIGVHLAHWMRERIAG